MNGRESAENVLELLFWTLERLSHPTINNLTESFESWEYWTRIKPRLRSLARSGYVTQEGRGGFRTVKFTERGRLAALGGVDPVARWRRHWDGKWRVVIFDLPASEAELRKKLWRWLKSQRFGYLQQSVWISPDPVDDTFLPLKHLKLSPENFTVIEGWPTPPERDRNLVSAAWDFPSINKLYSKVIRLCGALDEGSRAGGLSVLRRRQLLVNQRSAWLEAVSADPLLPFGLCPDDYQGKRAFEVRKATYDRMVDG